MPSIPKSAAPVQTGLILPQGVSLAGPAKPTASNRAPTRDIGALESKIYQDGIVGLPGLFEPELADRLLASFHDALAIVKNAGEGLTPVKRGPNRYYFACHPGWLGKDFATIANNPDLVALFEKMLGKDYAIVELGFDFPEPGATDQPWHRDFESPPEVAREGRLSSLAVNIPALKITKEMGAFQIAPRTQWTDGSEFLFGMFPANVPVRNPILDHLDDPNNSRQAFPDRGDASVRFAGTLHRGRANQSQVVRPVLVMSAIARDVAHRTDGVHQLHFTRKEWLALPKALRTHIKGHVHDSDRLALPYQTHDIECFVLENNKDGGSGVGAECIKAAQRHLKTFNELGVG
jgi:ectoine hydroxylase-related dioxygenase (phytanoyl-CoA dioxygenase family)